MALPFQAMGRPRTTPPPKGALEAAIGRQIEAWLIHSVRRKATQSDLYKILEKRSGVSDTTIAEVVKGTRSARIDVLAQLTNALGYTLLDLFQALENPRPETESQDGDGLSGTLQRHRPQPPAR